MFQQTIIRYCKFSNSNKQFCGRSNRASIAKHLTIHDGQDIIKKYPLFKHVSNSLLVFI